MMLLKQMVDFVNDLTFFHKLNDKFYCNHKKIHLIKKITKKNKNKEKVILKILQK